MQYIVREEVEAVTSLGTARVGQDHVEARVLHQRLERQPTCVAVEQSGATTIEAATILYALTEQATRAVLDGHMLNGSMIRPDSLATPGTGESIYIGSVLSAVGRESRALALLGTHLAALARQHPRTRWIFARAATPPGDRLLHRFKFRALAPPSEIRALALNSRHVYDVQRAANAGARGLVRLLRDLDDRVRRDDHL